MGASDYITPSELVARLAGVISEKTLANWRSKGTGPRFSRFGNRILYRTADVATWEAERAGYASTGQYGLAPEARA